MHAGSSTSRLLTVAIVSLVVAAVVWAAVPRPVPVDARVVARGTLRVRIVDDGVTRIRERHVISTPLAGHMNRIVLRPGDAVIAGKTVVTTIDPPDPALLDARAEADAVARMQAAKAMEELASKYLGRTRVEEEYAAVDLQRARELFPSKTVTHEQLDAAERAWKIAVSAVAEAREAVHVATHLVDMCAAALVRSRPSRDSDPRPGSATWRLDITPPIDGRVLRVLRKEAGLVEAGADLVEVGDDRDLEAVIDLVSEDAVRVAPGDACQLTAWGGDEPLGGHVRLVEPRGFTKVSPLGVEEQRVNVVVDIDSPPRGGVKLGDDFHVEAAIVVEEVSDAVLVPLAALFRREEAEAVFVAEGGRARIRRVEVGRRGDREAEVLVGLAAGERVIAYPDAAIAEGVRVVSRDR